MHPLNEGEFDNHNQTSVFKNETMNQDENTRGVLGLEQGKVHLHSYTSLWAELYQQEEEQIKAAIGHLIVDIQHVGSTAIPGIKAKPIIDMIAGVKRLEDALLCQAPLEVVGYEYIAQTAIPDDYVFEKKDVLQTHFLHVVEHRGRDWTNTLYFRDVLRSDPNLAQAYEALKVELSQKFSNSRAEYTAAKSAFIGKVITV